LKSWYEKLSVEYLYIFVFKEPTVYNGLKHINRELVFIWENDLMKKKILISYILKEKIYFKSKIKKLFNYIRILTLVKL